MTQKVLVAKADEPVAPSGYTVTPFQKPRAGERLVFEVNLVAEAEDKMRKQARVEPNLDTWSPFEIVCDEGSDLGGEDSAPPPLSYLSAGIAFCLLTHLQWFSKHQKLTLIRK